MRAIQSMHGGMVVLSAFSDGIGGGTGLLVNLTHILEEVPGAELSEVVGVSSVWPCAHHATFWGCVFDGLYKLDYAIGQAYKQKPLPEA